MLKYGGVGAFFYRSDPSLSNLFFGTTFSFLIVDVQYYVIMVRHDRVITNLLRLLVTMRLWSSNTVRINIDVSFMHLYDV